MAKRRCRDHSLVLKAKVAVAAMQDETGVFGEAVKVTPEPVTDVATLHAEIGGLTLENNFCPARSARRVFCRAQKND
jgi:hypothetical protein